YYGVPPVSESYLAPSSWAFNPDLPKHEYNPDKAKARLEEAGWKVGGDGIRAKNGIRLSFSNSTTAGNKVREQAQAFLQQNWTARRSGSRFTSRSRRSSTRTFPSCRFSITSTSKARRRDCRTTSKTPTS